MKKWIGVFLFSISCVFCHAQNDSTFRFHGRVIERNTFKPVAFATIQVVNKSKGTASNIDGSFSFPVNIGDKILITSIGYIPWMYTITAIDREDKRPYTVQMDPSITEVDGVEVVEFSENFYLRRPKRDTLKFDNPFLNTENPRDWNQTQILPLTNGQAGIVITGFLNSFDKRIKQEKILKEWEEARSFLSKREQEREEHFNKALVRRVTRIDERVIDEFMEFCGFLDGEVIGKSEFEITLKILDKYEAFLRR